MIFIVLLRGINVSGKHKIMMKDFVKLLSNQAEITSVKSYIQSGNFIVESVLKNNQELSKFFTAIVFKTYEYKITTISYTVDDFKNILSNYPFNPEDKRDYITFLTEIPASEKTTEFISKISTTDEFKINKNIIYVKYATKYSDSKLNNNYFEKQLQVTATTRNLNTVNKLIELSADIA